MTEKHRHIFEHIGGGCMVADQSDRACDDHYRCGCGLEFRIYSTTTTHFSLPSLILDRKAMEENMQTKEYRCYECGQERRFYPDQEECYAARHEGFCTRCRKESIFLGVNEGYGWDGKRRRFTNLPQDLKIT